MDLGTKTRSLFDKLSGAVTRVQDDVRMAMRSDPAADHPLEVALTYPGLHAVWSHQVAHELWKHGHKFSARLLAHSTRMLTGIEIHPGATLGREVFIDHGMGVVIGETAKVGDRCIIYKGVVLGGTSLERKIRHPQVGDDVVIGSNACLLGNIEIGDGAKVGSGSVVVHSVPSFCTVVGVPGRTIACENDVHDLFAVKLDHADLPDPVEDMLRSMNDERRTLENRVLHLERLLQVNPTSSEDSDPSTQDKPTPDLPKRPSLVGG